MLDIGALSAICTMLAFAKFPCTKPDNLASHRFTRPEGLVQCESILFIVWPLGTCARLSGARPDHPLRCRSQL